MSVRTLAASAAGSVVAPAGHAADAGLHVLGLTPRMLQVPSEVSGDLHLLFGGSIRLERVVIRQGSVPGVPHPRAFALPRLVYLGADPGVVRRRAPGGTASRDRATPTLVHELVHVWQGAHRGRGYLAEALCEQARYGPRAYDWRWWLSPAGGGRKRWSDLGVEAQAQLVMHGYALGLVAGCPPGFDAPDGAVPTSCPADAFDEPRHRRALDDALAVLRGGRADGGRRPGLD